MRFLVVTAVTAERDAVIFGLRANHLSYHIGPYEASSFTAAAGEVVAVAGGVGPSAAAAVTATALAMGHYDVCINIGVAGTFRDGGLDVTGIAVASELVAADLGAWAPDGFIDLGAMGLDGSGGVKPPAPWVSFVADRLSALPVAVGKVLTLSAMTGTDARADELFEKHGAVAEAMEGTGMAEAAMHHSTPVMEIRTMSNLVGDRDREVWELQPALARISELTPLIFGAPWPSL